MSGEWVIVKDPMAGDYETPHMTPKSLSSDADAPAWSLDAARLMKRLQMLYLEQNALAMQRDWLWNRVAASLFECDSLDKLGVLKF